jgi:adenosylcobinamide-GDP ribazoletransferase
MQAHSSSGSAVRAGAAALTFLTRVPVGRRFELDASDVARGAILFPLVGALTGAAVGLTAVALEAVVPAVVAAALALAVEALLTGAIHLDALADTADALGGETRERALEIMRDPHLGAFGVIALVFDLIVKVVAVVAVLEHERAVPLLVAAWAIGRSAPLALACVLPYARATPGSGTTLTDGAGRLRLVLGLAVGIGIAAAVAGTRSPALLTAAAICAVLVALTARARFGGVTGDVLGAAVELTTTLALVGAVATR